MMADGNVIAEGQRMAEMEMELNTLHIEYVGRDKEQCGDGRWLAKIKPTPTSLNSSERIRTRAMEKIRFRM